MSPEWGIHTGRLFYPKNCKDYDILNYRLFSTIQFPGGVGPGNVKVRNCKAVKFETKVSKP